MIMTAITGHLNKTIWLAANSTDGKTRHLPWLVTATSSLSHLLAKRSLHAVVPARKGRLHVLGFVDKTRNRIISPLNHRSQTRNQQVHKPLAHTPPHADVDRGHFVGRLHAVVSSPGTRSVVVGGHKRSRWCFANRKRNDDVTK